MLKASYYKSLPAMKSLQGAIQRHILLYGTPPVNLDDLDLTINNDGIIEESIRDNKLNVISEIGDYWGKKMVWLTLRPDKDYRLACESFDSYELGIKICKEFHGTEESCSVNVYQGSLGHISCFYL